MRSLFVVFLALGMAFSACPAYASQPQARGPAAFNEILDQILADPSPWKSFGRKETLLYRLDQATDNEEGLWDDFALSAQRPELRRKMQALIESSPNSSARQDLVLRLFDKLGFWDAQMAPFAMMKLANYPSWESFRLTISLLPQTDLDVQLELLERVRARKYPIRSGQLVSYGAFLAVDTLHAEDFEVILRLMANTYAAADFSPVESWIEKHLAAKLQAGEPELELAIANLLERTAARRQTVVTTYLERLDQRAACESRLTVE